MNFPNRQGKRFGSDRSSSLSQITGTELERLILIPVDRVTSENAADLTVRCTL